MKSSVLPYDKIDGCLSPLSVNAYVHIERSGKTFSVDKQLVSPWLYLHAEKKIW